MKPIVLSIFDRTGIMVEPWLRAGFECWIVDWQHEPGVHCDGNLVRVGADVHKWLPPRREYRIAFAFPPCTDLAVSGARWFKDKGLGSLSEAIANVEKARDILAWCECPWMLEQPVGTLSTYWREADVTFDPCDFAGYMSPAADLYTKRTCIWHGGGFRWPEKRWEYPVEGSRMHGLGPSANRADLRSETPRGFASAVFEANSTLPLFGGEAHIGA